MSEALERPAKLYINPKHDINRFIQKSALSKDTEYIRSDISDKEKEELEEKLSNNKIDTGRLAVKNSQLKGENAKHRKRSSILKQEVKELREALESARNGLLWQKDTYPEHFDKADWEKLDEWEQLLNN
jgi:hypothetical protein